MPIVVPRSPRNTVEQPHSKKDSISCDFETEDGGQDEDLQSFISPDEDDDEGSMFDDYDDLNLGLDATLRSRLKLKRARQRAPSSCKDQYLLDRGIKVKVMNWPTRARDRNAPFIPDEPKNEP